MSPEREKSFLEFLTFISRAEALGILEKVGPQDIGKGLRMTAHHNLSGPYVTISERQRMEARVFANTDLPFGCTDDAFLRGIQAIVGNLQGYGLKVSEAVPPPNHTGNDERGRDTSCIAGGKRSSPFDDHPGPLG